MLINRKKYSARLALTTAISAFLALAGTLCLPSAEARTGEAAASSLFDALKDDPLRLRLFLRAMPKGGDLHNHLSGSPYAEDYLDWAMSAGYCVDAAGTGIAAPPCAPDKALPTLSERAPVEFARLIDALSTRGIAKHASDGKGHDRFFSSFDRFNAISNIRTAQSIAAVRSMAAADKISYVESIHNPAALMTSTLAADRAPLTSEGLAARFAQEVKGIEPILTAAMRETDDMEAEARRAMACGTAQAQPGCHVTVRYLAWGWRDLPPAQAFRSLILAFTLAARDPRFVGVNIVQPEDWPIALRDYDLHMAMFRFLATKYPGVHRTMHAGELAFSTVRPADLRDHVRKAIEAGAERIGHGTDIAFEDDALNTIAKMARDKIGVEINLTSNAVILNVQGSEHPLSLYRRLGVPTMLSTDDEGVLRTDMTNEYVRAAREQGLGYEDLKFLARTSLEQAFVAGKSLWTKDGIGTPVAACTGSWQAESCQAFLAGSDKARLQAALEQQYAVFENQQLSAFDAMAGR